ncbi:uncharacterized protein At1g65710 [Mercurialis annua]|uniref:uncharacterized protein At1g65710 n=1 Tax=Mercurialis annua TaxID=3986 RepID=UPI00215F1F48|nr:uncharacterized protein At1g65710 [Mercurialis annua]
MGSCLSKKKESLNVTAAKDSSSVVTIKSFDDVGLIQKKNLQVDEQENIKKKPVVEEEVRKENEEEEEKENSSVKKEIFVIKHRKSHDRKEKEVPITPNYQKNVSLVEENGNKIHNNDEICEVGGTGNVVVRTSSCTKEEVDAILIQCGRLSRSNSSGKVAASSGRRYSGSKRSYDLDQDQDLSAEVEPNGTNYDEDDDEMDGGNQRRQHRQRHRQSGRSSPSPSSQGRRRTPSREREQRSGSRERTNGGGSGNGRRVSRSPGRRSESNANSNSSNGGNNTNRPGKKMVSVPATVSSLTMDKSNNGVAVEPQAANGVKRISVKRNVGAGEAGVTAGAGLRGASSPRSQSPARANARNGCNENNQQQQPTLSRSSSRKAEHSPYRRNPLSEIDTNSLVYAQTASSNKMANNNSSSRAQNQAQMQKQNVDTNSKLNSQVASKAVKEQTVIVEDAKVGVVASAHTLTRSRSARRSRDFDFTPETLLNPNPSYAALLLEDIHNFHQKSTNTNTNTTNTNTPSFPVPPCLTKACSILEAVADLNSSTTSSSIFGKKLAETKDPFVESEVLVNNDLLEPSFHKYVTVTRGGNGNGNGTVSVDELDGEESSGSNSFIGASSQQHWGYSTSSWEPNSADSTDRWTSRSNTRDEEDKSPLGFQKHTFSECGQMEEARRGVSGQRNGIGRGRIGSTKNVLAAAST